jgi:hypothetical protein
MMPKNTRENRNFEHEYNRERITDLQSLTAGFLRINTAYKSNAQNTA